MNGRQYDEPVSYADYGLDDETQGEKAAKAAKKFLPILVVLLIVGAGAYYIYDTFIGSVRTPTISIQNTEGEPLKDASIKIYSADGEELYRGAGQAIHTVELRKGTYAADVTAKGYELKREQVTISDSPQILIELEKKISAEITDTTAFPKSIVAGQTLQGQIMVKNNGKTAAEVELVFEGQVTKLGINVLQKPLVILAGNTETALVEITADRSTTIEEKEGDTLTGSVRVKYTNEKENVEIKLYPAPILQLREVDFGKLKAGSPAIDKDVTVTNRSTFPVTNLELSIEITSAQRNTPEQVIKWFKFTEVAGTETPTTIQIPIIEKSKIAEKKLRVDVPFTAKKEVISGNIVLNASFLSQPIRVPLTIEVSEETAILLIAAAKPEKLSIRWVEEQGRYEEKQLIVEFRNNSTLPIENILLSVQNAATCHVGWLRIAEQTIGELKPRETRELTLFASAPVSQRGNESTMNCKLRYKYDNPSPTGPTFLDQEIEGFVAITPVPE